MRKLYLVALMSCLGMLTAEAQMKYSEMPKIGDSYTMNVFDATGINVGSNGKDQVWDFSSLSKTDSFDLKVGDPKDQPEASSYPNADIAITNNYFGADQVSRHDLNIHYYKTGSSTLTKIGRVDKNKPTGGSVIFINKFGNEEVQMKLPVEFGSKNLDAWSGSYSSLGTPVTWSAGQNTYEVDATGTLKLPGKTIDNVLRVKRTRKYISNSTFGGTRVIEKVMYEWYIPTIPFPVMAVIENVLSGANTMDGFVMAEKEYKNIDANTSTVNFKAALSGVRVFPNPANHHLTVKMNSEENIQEIAVVDVAGKTVMNVSSAEIHGNESITLNVEQLKSGVYYLRVMDNESKISNHKIVITQN